MNFALAGFDIYALSAGFPSITSASFPGHVVPTGVVDLTYEIDLAIAGAYILDRSDAEALLLEFCA